MVLTKPFFIMIVLSYVENHSLLNLEKFIMILMRVRSPIHGWHACAIQKNNAEN